VPKAPRAYGTRHQLALEMLEKNGASLPLQWITGDDEMGRPSWFRRRLAALGEQYLLAVPSNTSMRNVEVAPPEYSGRGRRPQRPWQHVEVWSQSLDEKAWQRIEVHDGSKGPLMVEAVKRQMVSRTHRRQQGDQETLVVMRYRCPCNRSTLFWSATSTAFLHISGHWRIALDGRRSDMRTPDA
jgi:DDE superfamily endonuclease